MDTGGNARVEQGEQAAAGTGAHADTPAPLVFQQKFGNFLERVDALNRRVDPLRFSETIKRVMHQEKYARPQLQRAAIHPTGGIASRKSMISSLWFFKGAAMADSGPKIAAQTDSRVENEGPQSLSSTLEALIRELGVDVSIQILNEVETILKQEDEDRARKAQEAIAAAAAAAKWAAELKGAKQIQEGVTAFCSYFGIPIVAEQFVQAKQRLEQGGNQTFTFGSLFQSLPVASPAPAGGSSGILASVPESMGGAAPQDGPHIHDEEAGEHIPPNKRRKPNPEDEAKQNDE